MQDGNPARPQLPQADLHGSQPVSGETLPNGPTGHVMTVGGKALVSSPPHAGHTGTPLTCGTEEHRHSGANFPTESETSPNPNYERHLPPLPPHLSHLPVPPPPLMRTDSSTSALNPFLAHRPVGLPPLAWDLRAGARAILFPSVALGGGPALPMAASDYAQPATWPPCGALRIGAIGEHAGWRWPVEAHNPAGVRCGDVFRALVANLHEFVSAHEIARMPPERVALVVAACAARVAAGMPPGSAANDGIRRVDCLLGCTQFHGLEPGPSAGEWTMYVGAL